MPNSFLAKLKQANNGGADLEVFAYGTGTLVSGAATINTGLSSVSTFIPCLIGTGAHATGVTEAAEIQVLSGPVTGAVSCIGVYGAATGVTITSVSGTSSFFWLAIGTP